MWNLVEAIQIINKLEPHLEEFGFCLGLTGGVFFRCHSRKDLDLVLYPMRAVKPDYLAALNSIQIDLTVKSIVAVNHPVDAKLVFTIHLEDGRRIDLFFPGYTYAERNDKYSTAGEIDGSGSSEELEKEAA